MKQKSWYSLLLHMDPKQNQVWDSLVQLLTLSELKWDNLMVANQVVEAGFNFQTHAGASFLPLLGKAECSRYSEVHFTANYIHISSKHTTMCFLKAVVVGSETFQRKTAWGLWMKRKDLTEPPSLFLAGGWNRLLHLLFLKLQEFHPIWAVLYKMSRREQPGFSRRRRERRKILQRKEFFIFPAYSQWG